MSMRTLCVTLGDPCGIGPELVVRHFTEAGVPDDERILLIGPELALERELEFFHKPSFFRVIKSLRSCPIWGRGCIF